MKPPHRWSDDVDARFTDWVEQFYEANTDQLFEQAISDLGRERVRVSLAKLVPCVLQKTEEQFSGEQIGQFLAAVEEERCYDEVQQFCRQIAECQQLWSIVTGCGVNQWREQLAAVCEVIPAGADPNRLMSDGGIEKSVGRLRLSHPLTG
jgi:hypothetical protein